MNFFYPPPPLSCSYVLCVYIASTENNRLIICGDANLCSLKWSDENYVKKEFAQPMLETLESCDLVNKDIRVTFTADHVNKNGVTSESAIDHVYVSKEINKNVEVKKLLNSASDHFLIKRVQKHLFSQMRNQKVNCDITTLI